MLLNYLIASLLLVSSPGSEEKSDGWFPVEQKDKHASEGEEIDPSIWVVFAKNLGAERFHVRFPADPAYHLLFPGTLEVFSSKDGERFHLWVTDSKESFKDFFEKRAGQISEYQGASLIQSDPESGDIRYFVDGKWVEEHLSASREHFFLFQTTSGQPESGNHLLFVKSFHIEKNR